MYKICYCHSVLKQLYIVSQVLNTYSAQPYHVNNKKQLFILLNDFQSTKKIIISFSKSEMPVFNMFLPMIFTYKDN